METVHTLIIGAGVVGLAIAERLSRKQKDVIVVERHDGFGRETSSRNSEVIHCGMYYREDLLKTRLCVRGNPLMYELCGRQGIPFLKTGKIVVATDDEEEATVQRIFAQGRKNGVPGLRLATRGEVGAWEPQVRCTLALASETTGIVSSHALMDYLQRSAASRGGDDRVQLPGHGRCVRRQRIRGGNR